MRRIKGALLVILVSLMAVAAFGAQSPVKQAPTFPAHLKSAAKLQKEHADAAAYAKKMVADHKAMARHYTSLAAEYKKLGRDKLAKHYTKLSKLQSDAAKEFAATANTHGEHAKAKGSTATKGTSSAESAVKQGPVFPAHLKAAAKTPQEYKRAADYAEKMVSSHKSMAEHFKSLASEHKKKGQDKLAKHYTKLSKIQTALAKEYESLAVTYKKGSKSQEVGLWRLTTQAADPKGPQPAWAPEPGNRTRARSSRGSVCMQHPDRKMV
jgi:hypothetical protein